MGYYDAAQIAFDSSRGRFIAGGVWHWVWCWEISHFPALRLMLLIYFSQTLVPVRMCHNSSCHCHSCQRRQLIMWVSAKKRTSSLGRQTSNAMRLKNDPGKDQISVAGCRKSLDRSPKVTVIKSCTCENTGFGGVKGAAISFISITQTPR